MQSRRAAWTELLIAVVLIALAAGLAYLPFAAGLGFYHDDWFTVASRVSGVYLTDMHAGDRPMMGWLYEAVTRVLGERPLLWHLFAAGGRMFAAFMLWVILKLLWPRQRVLAVTAAILFAVYPGFLQQPSANNYSNHIVAYSAGLTSLAFSLAAVRLGRRWWAVVPLLAASAALTRIYPAVYETFIGLEGVRLLMIWYALGPAQAGKRMLRIGRTLLYSLPNLIAGGWFLYWRFFVFESKRPATDTAGIMQNYTTGGLSGLLRIPIAFFGDILDSLIAAWFVPLSNLLHGAPSAMILLGLGLGLLLCAALWFALRAPSASPSTGSAADTSLRDAAWVGLASLALTTLPVILAGRDARFDSYMDRYTFQSSALVALTLAAGIGLLLRPALRLPAVMLLCLLALLTHTLNAANYREVWRLQRSMWWQLSWRAPQLKPDTVLIPLMPDGYRFIEDFEIWAPANRIYQPQPKTIFVSGSIVTEDAVDLMKDQGVIGRTWRLIRYEKRFDQALVLSMPTPESCLHVLDGSHPELSSQDADNARRLASISKLDRIRTGVENAVPSAALFGPEPTHDWCYSYQKADLARQMGDWETVKQIYQLVLENNQAPKDVIEWLPFYQVFLATGDKETANRIGEKIRADQDAWLAYCGEANPEGSSKQDLLSAELCR